MLRYRYLVLDHDDTVVRSESTVNYPAFLEALRVLRPGMTVSPEEFSLWTYREGFSQMCANHFGFDDQEFRIQYEIWLNYAMHHIPPAFPGMKEQLIRYREAGGLVSVSSHSARENILRDYEAHFGFCPDNIYDWNLGPEQRKPAPYALDDLMRRYGFSPREILVVDDLPTGWEMAKSRGVDFAWAGWNGRNIPEIEAGMTARSTHLLRNVKDLEKILIKA